MSPKFTAEGSVEATPGTVVAGAGAVEQIANLGVLSFSMATSESSGHLGAQLSVGAQRVGRLFSLGASAIVARQYYVDVAAINGTPVPRKQLDANAGLSLRRFGSMGMAYAGLDQGSLRGTVATPILPAQHSHIVSANYSIQIHRVSIYATEFKDISTTGSSSGLQVGLTVKFGKRSSMGSSAASSDSVQVQVQQPAVLVGDWGYEGYVAASDEPHEFAQVQYKSPWGLFTAGLDQTGGQITLRMEGQGALSLVDRSLFPSNTIFDSFAIVDTNRMPHVHVLQENREVGQSNASGRLLVPDMRSFDLNSLAIAATDIPPDASIHDATREVRPQDRSGVIVRFAVKISHDALLKLVDETEVPMPVGSTATLQPGGVAVPIGYDGDAYVEDLSPHNELIVERPDGQRCRATFDYVSLPDEIPIIGPLPCRELKP